MKHIWLLFLIAFTLGFVLGCDKNGSLEWVSYSGIVVTDIEGNVYSKGGSDWCGGVGLPDTTDAVGGVLPTTYRFGYAYPNPAKDSTIIAYGLPMNSRVHLWIEDRYGQNIFDLVNDYVAAGYEYPVWHLQNANGERVLPGIYRAYINAGDMFYCDGDILVE